MEGNFGAAVIWQVAKFSPFKYFVCEENSRISLEPNNFLLNQIEPSLPQLLHQVAPASS